MYDSVSREADLRKAPPMDILPMVADSAVISRETLLELPPPASEPAAESTESSVTSDSEVKP